MNTQGQLNENTDRGIILKNIIKKINPKTIVEIGTWKGLGSTKCILDSINKECEFFSLESNLEFYEIAKKNLKTYLDKFNLLYGRIIEKKDIINFVKEKNLSQDQKNWLNDDVNNIEKCENILQVLPKNIDFLLLDGGEFSTYSEWGILKDRVKYVALDDIRELKTKQIYQELISDINYELIEKTDDGNGFCVFLKK